MTSQNENPPNNGLKPSETMESLGLYDDIVKSNKNHDDGNSDERQESLFLSSKMDAHTSYISERNHLIDTFDFVTDRQLKIDNNCRTQQSINADTKSENKNIRELIINIKSLNAETDSKSLSKETCLNSKNDNYNSVVIDINLKPNTTHNRKNIKGSQAIETMKPDTNEHKIIKDTFAYKSNDAQKSNHCNEENTLHNKVTESSGEKWPYCNSRIECGNAKKIENDQLKDKFTESKREKSVTVYRTCSVLRNATQNKETLKEKVVKITTVASKPKTFSEDSDVIIISSTEEDNCDSEKPVNILTENIVENDLNTNLHPRSNFHEVLDNELEILKAQYSDIEKKITIAAMKFTCEEILKSTWKVKKELTSCMQSLEKLSVSLSNKWFYAKSQIPKEQTKPSYTFHQQYQKKLDQTPTDKLSYQSQAFTKLTKIESHHHYEFDSPLQPWQTIKAPHNIQKRLKDCSGSEDDTCKNLRKKKRKLSQYSYDRNVQQYPETEIKSYSKKCCLPKKCTSYSKAKDTEFRNCRNEPNYISGIGGFSKSFVAHRQMTIARSTPKHFTNYCHLNKTLQISNPTKGSGGMQCNAMGKSGMQYDKGIRLHKYHGKYEIDSDLSDSSELSSISEKDFSSIPTYHKATRAKCCNRAHNLNIKSHKKNDIVSKKEKTSKRVKKNKYESDEMSFSSSNTNTSIEKMKSSRKRHKHKEKVCNHNIEKKRVHNLIDRQMSFINNHVSRKADKTKPTQDSFIDCHRSERYKVKEHFNKKKSKEETNSSEDMSPILENMRKRKFYEQHPKQAKINYQSDLRTILHDKHKNDNFKGKYRRDIALPSQHSISPVATHSRSPYKLSDKMHHIDDDQYNLKNKYYTERHHSKLQMHMSPTSAGTSTADIHSPWKMTKTEHRKDDDRNNLKNKYNDKKLQSYIVPPSSPYTVKHKKEDKDPERVSEYSEEVENTDKIQQKSRSDIADMEGVTKDTVRAPENFSGVTDNSVTKKPIKKKPIENKNEAFVSTGKFDLFFELNREIRKCNKKRPPKTSNKIPENKISSTEANDDNFSFKKDKSSNFQKSNYLKKEDNFREEKGTWSD